MKVKNLIVAVALLLVTIGVFAGRGKFASFVLQYDVNGLGSTFNPITTGFPTLQNITTTSTNNRAVSITTSNGSYELYVQDGSGPIQRVYTNVF